MKNSSLSSLPLRSGYRLVAAAILSVANGLGTCAYAQCNCTCDALVPSSQQINASLMNESGASPTHLVSAGGPGGVAREIRHGNLFTGGITITHVCIALQSPSGQPGDIANIQIYQPDPDPLAFNLPGAKLYDQQFQVSPGFNGHQIVQLVSPQTMGANFWLVVAYPTAQPAIGHQGTRPRTQGNSAVFIHPPGAGTGWKYYDDMGGPGGTAGYYQQAAIIRPLNIGASSSVCPYGQQCCATVCNIQPGCCIQWSPQCEQLALQNCFPGGCATCPPNGVPEGEACGTDNNGGCDTNGAFQQINCDTLICGSLWRSPTLIDTDWYTIDVVDLNGDSFSFFTFTVESEVSIEVRLQNDRCPIDPLWVTYTADTTQACITKVFGGAVPSPGRYRISVRPVGIVPLCPQQSKYTLWVDVDDCPGPNPPPSNNTCGSAGSPYLNPGTLTFDTTGATTDGPAEPCGFSGVNDADVWFNFPAPCNGTATLQTVASFDRLLAAYTMCPNAGGVLIACGTGIGPIPASISFPTVAGQIYTIRAGGKSGAQGIVTMQIDFATCQGDINKDCKVNVNDLLAVINAWGPCPQPCRPYCPADINHDCQVNVADLLAVINRWGPCP